MSVRGIFSAVAAAALVAAPTVAAAAPVPARTTTHAVTPADENVDGENALLGGGVFVAVIAAIAVIIGIIIVANEDDSPNSP